MRIKTFAFALLLGINLTSCAFMEASKEVSHEDTSFYIRTGADFAEVLDSLQGKLIDLNSFKTYAESKNYQNRVKAGKYNIKAGMTNKELVTKLMLGEQDEVRVRIKNEPTIFHMAGSVSKSIEADSAQIVDAIRTWAKEKDPNLTEETVKYFFVPETYFMYWSSTGEQFVARMVKEFDKVWTDERQQKAEAMNFTPLQVFTLSSIVQMESSHKDEQPKVAQAYLNRLAKGMKLEADPTSVYAYKLENGFDHTILRVKGTHLAVASEYNTYKVQGLPPAPICLPNLSAVDAVLNPEVHPYVFFCADPERSGYHKFTNSYAEHLKNAAVYRKWLNEKGIK